MQRTEVIPDKEQYTVCVVKFLAFISNSEFLGQ